MAVKLDVHQDEYRHNLPLQLQIQYIQQLSRSVMQKQWCQRNTWQCFSYENQTRNDMGVCYQNFGTTTPEAQISIQRPFLMLMTCLLTTAIHDQHFVLTTRIMGFLFTLKRMEMKMTLIPVAHQVVVDKEEVVVMVVDEVAEAKGDMAEGPVLVFKSTRKQMSLVNMRRRPQLILAMMLLHTCHTLHLSCP